MKLLARTLDTFYGVNPDSLQIEGLKTALKNRTVQGETITTLTFLDEEGVKWEIKPTAFSKKGIPSMFRLYHRNTYGRRGFHSQHQCAWGGKSAGIRELMAYICKHEAYERGDI